MQKLLWDSEKKKETDFFFKIIVKDSNIIPKNFHFKELTEIFISLYFFLEFVIEPIQLAPRTKAKVFVQARKGRVEKCVDC
jgi:hypothetical protein